MNPRAIRCRPFATAILLTSLAGTVAGQASYTTWRQSCPGSAGTPHLVASAPVPGFHWELHVDALRPATAGFLIFALRDDRFGSAPLPFDLAPLGAPGCHLNVDSDPATGGIAELLPADATGNALFSLDLPAVASLLGQRFYNQYVSLDAPAGRPLQITTTDSGRATIGRPGWPGGPEFVEIPAGSFMMGSLWGYADEQPPHTVEISRPFWMCRWELRQSDWSTLMGNNPSAWQGPSRPVESVSWNTAQTFCTALTNREREAGRLPHGYVYRLPTEAEWEYCCRAGTITEFNTGASLDCSLANHARCIDQTADVGSYPANAFGLQDLHGNVYEWCLDGWDWTANYPAVRVVDPYVATGPARVFRGGGWQTPAAGCRSARRNGYGPTYHANDLGLRVVLAPPVGS